MRALYLLAAMVAAPSLAFSQASRPEGWWVKADVGTADSVAYDRMPPGWHITTGPASILYDAVNQARGRFAVDAEIHLFPGTSDEGYGVFIGGSTRQDGESWIAFLITRDGSATIERRTAGSTTTLYPRTRAPSIKPHPGGEGTAFNAIRVLVQGDSAVFSANGQRITAIPTRDLPVEGTFGFRVGKNLNLHITNLDLVTRLAPFPVRR
jgi:hypothetical protein